MNTRLPSMSNTGLTTRARSEITAKVGEKVLKNKMKNGRPKVEAQN